MTAELSTDGAWVRDDPVDVAEYARLLRTDAPKPAGLAIAQARRAFARGRSLPPGGVLLGIDSAAGDGWQPGGTTEHRCDVRTRTDRAGRAVVTFDVDLRTPGVDASPSRVRFVIRWEAAA
ncbi:hypothetical protein QF046_001911 [Microbacterium sp. W4I4]|uniref:hypothetical protein n=1 Tax=Microbacterium sp. W4I4 TaxID=3042295 RepID=UPI0027825C97|nr:hypothetical protein [Microbacterium sp. W4I4]MDQ0614270.1 hypothetical protein [Microbacterium sp. W4I4]